MRTFAVVTPSRGLVHSRTIEAVMLNVAETGAGRGFRGWFLTHDLPIPDCDERVAELGLRSGAQFLWWIEEDVIPPAGTLMASMHVLEQGYAVAAVDYPVGAPKDAWGCLVRNATGDILWCGLGCTLIRRTVFERLARPWFTTDWQYVKQGVGGWEPRPAPQPNARRYGQQDIHFCMELTKAGFRIGQVPKTIAGHAYVVALGEQGSNVGYHTISIRDAIARQYPG